MLKFSRLSNNTKLKWMGKGAYSFSTLAGWSCPGACKCLSKVVETPEGRRIQDGPNIEYRCYAASQALIFKNLYEQQKHNMEEFSKVANSKENTVKLIQESLPKDSRIIRLYVSGDVANQRIFDSWCEIAKNNSNVQFYMYTKSLIFWVRRLGQIPENFTLTASRGSKYDELIDQHKLRHVTVVYSEYQARKLKIPVDHDDRHAILRRFRDTNFAIVVHNQGPAGSKHALSWKRQLQGKNKFHGYTSGKNFGKYYKKETHRVTK